MTEDWRKFAFEFHHDNKTYNFHLWATSFEHAEQLMAALKDTIYLVGRVEVEIDT